tara:strand:- start:3479 stop:4060 length:582 start_codon:yes stop_codon:yes gene_type:complete
MICIFLGYGKKETRLIKLIESKNIKVINLKRSITLKDIKKADIIISFGYKKIITEKLLKSAHRPIINLHMSYLPFNRGAHPNFWSFIDNTPKGVTIHEINKKIDAGNIIVQKKFNINIKKRKFSSFKKTYNFLFKEIENLFEKNIKKILSNNYSSYKQKGKATSHHKSNLPKSLKLWNVNILKYKKFFFSRSH